MASTTVNVFLVDKATASNPRPAPSKQSVITVPGDGDQAKREARDTLVKSGYDVRTLNWGPGKPGTSANELYAYVMLKGAS